MKIDFYRHPLRPSDADAVADVLATPFLTTGSVARAVEAQLTEYFGVAHAVLVNSWTNGALAVLLAMDLRENDEIIVPAMTFIASANVVELARGKVVFADVDERTLLLTPEIVEKHVTCNTRAVMPVHLYGQMCDLTNLRRMLDTHPARSGRISIIEDCAHCFEGERGGIKPGQVSDVAIFSFYATKNITCGEGGAIITQNEELYSRILETRLHGMSAVAVDRFASGRYNHWDMKRLGTKANLPDILASLLPHQIKAIDQRLPERCELANRYRAAMKDGPLRLVAQLPNCKSAEHIFPVGIPGGARDLAIAALNANGVPVTVNYRSVPATAYYKERFPNAAAACPVAYSWGEETLTLPLFPGMARAEQDYVIERVRSSVYPLLSAPRPARLQNANSLCEHR